MTRHAALLVGLLTITGSPAFAQTQSTAPAHLAVVDGDVAIERGPASEPANLNMALVTGDRLRTGQGRAELILEDGSAIHVDERTVIDLNSERVLRLLAGRIIILAEAAAAGSLQVDAIPASVRVLSAGEYRLSLFGDGRTSGLDVAVVRGEADVAGDGGSAGVRAGEMVSLREGEAPTWPTAFNTAQVDAFVAWSESLTDGRRGTTSAQYLPEELQVYSGSLDRYGTWGYAKPHGYVWYPRVTPGWRPYYEGRWRWTIGFGWTWVGGHPWAWPTHHYGRWGFSTTGSWYWIPARGWSTAWVHWAVSPGYIGWCPLGWDNRPVLSFWGHPRPVPYRGFHNPWYAWSVVRSGHFRQGAFVHRSQVARAAFTGRDAPAFVVQAAPPNIAVPRHAGRGSSTRPARDVAVPRGRTFTGDTVVRRGTVGSPTATATARGPGQSVSGTTRGGAPSVIYHRGRTPSSRDSSRARAYDRTGVAVRRGVPESSSPAASPSSRGAPTAAVRSRPATARERAGAARRTLPPTRSSAIAPPSRAVAAPRRAIPSSVRTPSPASISRGPRDGGAVAPRGRPASRSGVSAAPGRPSGSAVAPRRGGGQSSRATAPPSQSSSRAGAPSRAGSSPRAGASARGRSSGTAVPRQGGSRRPN